MNNIVSFGHTIGYFVIGALVVLFLIWLGIKIINGIRNRQYK